MNSLYAKILRSVSFFYVALIFLGLNCVPALAASSTLNKTGRDTTTNSTSSTSSGDTVKWIIDYANTSLGDAAVNFSDPIPGHSQYVNNSLQVPKNWDKKWSTGVDCSTASITQPAPTSVSHVCSGSNYVPSPATGLGAPAPQPQLSFTQSTDIDAYAPIVYKGKVFTLAHHVSSFTCQGVWNSLTSTCTGTNLGNRRQLDCADQASGLPCPGFSSTAYATSTPGAALGTGPHDLGTTQYIREYIDTGTYGDADHMYFAAARPDSPGTASVTEAASAFGVGCINLSTYTSCGFTQLGIGQSELYGENSNAIFEGLQQSGNRLYGVAYDGKMYCYDMTTDLACAGQPFTTGWTAWNKSGKDRGMYVQHYTASDSRQYWLINYATGCSELTTPTFIFPIGFVNIDSCAQVYTASRLWCFDPGTQAACAGWTAPSYSLGGTPTVLGAGVYNISAAFSIYEQRDVSNVIDKICVAGITQQSIIAVDIGGFNYCHTLSGGASSLPAGFFNNVSGGSRVLVTNGTPVVIGTKMYVTVFTVDTNPDPLTPDTYLICWDYSTAAQCTGYGNYPGGTPTVQNFPLLAGGSGNPSGYTVREYNGCVWMAGDSLGSSSAPNDIWSVDPRTGNYPCRKVNSNLTITPNTDYYCDGAAGHVTAWDKLQIRLPSGTNYGDFFSIKVTIRDGAGAIIGAFNSIDLLSVGGPVTALGELDISGISYGTYPNIVADVLFDAQNTNPWPSPGVSPVAYLTFVGDSPQICFETVSLPDCDTVIIDNVATAVTTDGSGSDTQTSSKSFLVDHTPGTSCVPNVKVTKTNGLTLIHAGDTFTYDIRVDNLAEVSGGLGQGDISSATLDDSLPSYLEFVDAPANGACPAGSGTPPNISWALTSLAAGGSITCKLTVKLANSFAGSNINNTATVDLAGEDPALLSDNISSYGNVLGASVGGNKLPGTPGQLAAAGAGLVTVGLSAWLAYKFAKQRSQIARRKSQSSE